MGVKTLRGHLDFRGDLREQRGPGEQHYMDLPGKQVSDRGQGDQGSGL